MPKLRAGILSALILGIATVAAAEHGPPRFSRTSSLSPTRRAC